MSTQTKAQAERKRAAVVAEAVNQLIYKQRKTRKFNLVRKERKRTARASTLIAYDLETTRIKAGTPRPLYITAHGANFSYASPIVTMQSLHVILCNYFLTEENHGVKFIAWNGNRFDAYFVAAALIDDKRFLLRPYLTKSKALRGLRVTLAEDGDNRTKRCWEFLDGIAMLGLQGTSLEKLLANFAPDYAKLTGVIDFEREEFDPNNPAHCDYAMRDSVGLYHAMTRAQDILLQRFNEPLAVTMGGACIKIFQAHIPREVKIDALDSTSMQYVRDYVMRGGFCYCNARYQGPVWKYDINQAYAAAMRDAKLPCGGLFYSEKGLHESAVVYIARCEASNPHNKIPFYYRTLVNGKLRSTFSRDYISETWLTSIEIEQLRSEGWRVDIHESYQWGEHFNMREYVDKLEVTRTTCEGGPSGPIGTMTKAVGNHSYGKTLEFLEPIEFMLAGECPDGWAPYYGDGADPLEHVYFRFLDDARVKAYHQPQIGAFITAHVRMVLRRAALIDPDAWLYADTDCVVFSRDVTASLDIDPKRYGAWKLEEAGTEYQIIAKKVYAQVSGDKPTRHAKGLNVKRLSADDFNQWFKGEPPTQDQTQINNFLRVIRGEEMYRTQRRKGTRVELKNAA